MLLAHEIRLRPSRTQEEYFRHACGVARFTYNWALEHWKSAYEAGEKPSGSSLKKQFNAIRREKFPWTYEVHRDCTAQSFTQLQKAFTHFFHRMKAGRKPGYPKFKKRGGCKDSFYIANDRFRLDNKRIHLPKIGWVRLREVLRFEGMITSAIVKRVADAWFVVVQVDVGDYRRDRIANSEVGVDLGIRSSATLSTGEHIQGPKALKKNLRKLQRESRWHSRKQKGSANRRKSTMKLARLHRRIGYVRSDYLHKLSTRLCRENQAIGIEDLAVQNMVRNRRLSRHIVDEGWGGFRRQINYKAVIFDDVVVVHDRFYASSKTCFLCCEKRAKLSLSERTFKCACGWEIDRDVNAALNLLPWVTREVTLVEKEALVLALAETKLPLMKQELTPTPLCVGERYQKA